MMNSYLILLFAAVVFYLSDYTVTKCLDTTGIYILDNKRYVPKFNNCMMCICTNDRPANCEPVQCSIPAAYDCNKISDQNACCAVKCRKMQNLKKPNNNLKALNKHTNHTKKKNYTQFFKEWKAEVAKDFRTFFRM